MGTNYYLNSGRACPTCGHEPEPLHIGKSSAGWVFALRVYPGKGIRSLEDWLPLLLQNPIVDEYGKSVEPADMLRTISCRQPGLQRSHDLPELAKRGVARCDGTWELYLHEFS